VGGLHEEATGIKHDLAGAVGTVTFGAAAGVEQVFAAFKRRRAGGGGDRLDVQRNDTVELLPTAELGISDSAGAEGDNDAHCPQEDLEKSLHRGAPSKVRGRQSRDIHRYRCRTKIVANGRDWQARILAVARGPKSSRLDPPA